MNIIIYLVQILVKIIILFMLFSFGPTFCNKVKIAGKDAPADQFPFVVGIVVSYKAGAGFCGGSLITDQWVLTSAICIRKAVVFNIKLGSNSLTTNDSNRLTVTASKYYVHPNYDPSKLNYNIGLIKLEKPVITTDYVKPIPLTESPVKSHADVMLIGWSRQTNEYPSETLKYWDTVTLEDTACESTYFLGNSTFKDIVCVQGNCLGETGSPLIQNLNNQSHLVGIVNFFNIMDCDQAFPSGFTRVFPYIKWIKSLTEKKQGNETVTKTKKT